MQRFNELRSNWNNNGSVTLLFGNQYYRLRWSFSRPTTRYPYNWPTLTTPLFLSYFFLNRIPETCRWVNRTNNRCAISFSSLRRPPAFPALDAAKPVRPNSSLRELNKNEVKKNCHGYESCSFFLLSLQFFFHSRQVGYLITFVNPFGFTDLFFFRHLLFS